MVDFFCKSIAASNFCDDRKFAPILANQKPDSLVLMVFLLPANASLGRIMRIIANSQNKYLEPLIVLNIQIFDICI